MKKLNVKQKKNLSSLEKYIREQRTSHLKKDKWQLYHHYDRYYNFRNQKFNVAMIIMRIIRIIIHNFIIVVKFTLILNLLLSYPSYYHYHHRYCFFYDNHHDYYYSHYSLFLLKNQSLID